MIRSGTLIGYGLGDFGINLYFMSVMTFLLVFYTDVMGIPPLTAAAIFAFARFVDAITDPLMGMIAERTQSRWGRLRPYLLFGGAPLGLAAVLTFTVPDLSLDGRIIWAYVTYTLFGVIYTMVTIPYTTLTASMTMDYSERTRLSSYRIGFAFAGGWLTSLIFEDFVRNSFFDSVAQGHFVLMIVFAFIATILLWITYYSVEEVVVPRKEEKPNLKESFQSVFRNPPLFIVIGIFCCGMMSFTVRMAVTPYYFIYNVGDPSLIGLFLATTLGAMIIAVWLVPVLSERFGKTGAMRLGAYLTIFSCIGFYFAPADSILQIFVWGTLVAIGSTPVAVLGWAMIPDTIEYAQSKFGHRADGMISSTASFFQKLAKTVGGAGVAFVLGISGYVANQNQTQEALSAIHALLTLAPIPILLVLILLTLVYRLDEQTHDEIVRGISASDSNSNLT